MSAENAAPTTTPSYPECEKLRALHPERMALLAFIEWLHQDKKWTIAQPLPSGERYMPVLQQAEAIVFEYLGVDTKKLEEERRAMLSALQERTA